MKKIIIMLCALVFPVLVNAKEYTVVDMILDLDDSKYEVITLDNMESSKYLSDKRVNVSELKKEFEENNVYLEAIYDEDNYNYSEYTISVEKVNIRGNLRDYSDSDIIEAMSEYKDDISTLYDSGVYSTKNNKFFYLDYKYGISYNVSYFTVVNDKLYIITYRNNSKELTTNQKAEVKNVLDNIKYTHIKSGNGIFNSEDSLTDIIKIILIFAIGSLFAVVVGKFILPKNKKNVI